MVSTPDKAISPKKGVMLIYDAQSAQNFDNSTYLLADARRNDHKRVLATGEAVASALEK